MRRFRARGSQYSQKKLFRCNQKALYQELRKICSSSIQCREAKEFWSELWDTPFSYKEDAEWLKEIELELENVNIQENVEITMEDITMQLKKMPN